MKKLLTAIEACLDGVLICGKHARSGTKSGSSMSPWGSPSCRVQFLEAGAYGIQPGLNRRLMSYQVKSWPEQFRRTKGD